LPLAGRASNPAPLRTGARRESAGDAPGSAGVSVSRGAGGYNYPRDRNLPPACHSLGPRRRRRGFVQRAFPRLAAHLRGALEDFTRTFGMNNRNIFKTLLPRELDEEEFWRLSERKEQYFRAGIRGNCQLLPGVLDWLQRFDQLGLKQAIASSAPQQNIDAHLDELDIRHWFTAVASGEKLRGKPDPAVFLLAASLLKVAPSECLVIEDAVPGVAAARSAGMRCLAVLTTNPAEKLSRADLIVHDLTHFTPQGLAFLNNLV